MTRYRKDDVPDASDIADEKYSQLLTQALNIQKEWLYESDEWYHKAVNVLESYHYHVRRLGTKNPFLISLITSIQERMRILEKEGIEDVISSILDEESLAKDPYKYYGVSRRDFI